MDSFRQALAAGLAVCAAGASGSAFAWAQPPQATARKPGAATQQGMNADMHQNMQRGMQDGTQDGNGANANGRDNGTGNSSMNSGNGMTNGAGAKQTAGAGGDDAIARQVKDQIMNNDETRHSLINVSALNGVVTLTGHADSHQAATQAEQIARSTNGVKKVDDRIQIASSGNGNSSATGARNGTAANAAANAPSQTAANAGGANGQQVADRTITRRVTQQLNNDSSLDGTNLKVSTNSGTVKLSGTVDSQAQKSHAEQVARGVSGVTEVKATQLNVAANSTSHDQNGY
jgi:osmotically-inducible protein OsmY